jgi:tRNA nucleotidyltransferase (CCA-adding enzyme)
VEPIISNSIRRQILAEITPCKEEIELQKSAIDSLKSALSSHPSSHEYRYSFIEAQGSTGRKQTQLRGAADIDLFVGLRPEDYDAILERPPQIRHREIDNLMKGMIKNWFEPALADLDTVDVQLAFSQHPYLSLKMSGLDIDILGCFDINQDQLSARGPFTAVDRTVHHTHYVADRLTEEKREDARILKSFVRACHAYGDRCAVGRMGITGVSLELLAILSHNLDDAIEKLEKLRDSPIDPKERTLKDLRKIPAFKDDYIILIDPTDHQRNIASSFTPRAYECVKYRIGELQKAALAHDENKLIELMIEAPIPSDPLPDWLAHHAFTREFKSDGSRHYTILRDKLYHAAAKAQAALQVERTGEPRFGETLVEVIFEEDTYSIGFLIETPKISKDYLRRGPPITLFEAAEQFRKSHSDVDERDGYLWIKVEREWDDPKALTDMVLAKSTIRGLKQVPEAGEVSQKALNVLYRFIMPLDQAFYAKMTRVKDKAEDIQQ